MFHPARPLKTAMINRFSVLHLSYLNVLFNHFWHCRMDRSIVVITINLITSLLTIKFGFKFPAFIQPVEELVDDFLFC